MKKEKISEIKGVFRLLVLLYRLLSLFC